MNLLLPFYSSRQEIGLVHLASELFTIYFTISAQAISLSPPSGRYECLTPPYFSPLITFNLFNAYRKPKHLQHLIQTILWTCCFIVCVSVSVCICVFRHSDVRYLCHYNTEPCCLTIAPGIVSLHVTLKVNSKTHNLSNNNNKTHTKDVSTKGSL